MILSRFGTSFQQYPVRSEQDFSQFCENIPPQILARHMSENLEILTSSGGIIFESVNILARAEPFKFWSRSCWIRSRNLADIKLVDTFALGYDCSIDFNLLLRFRVVSHQNLDETETCLHSWITQYLLIVMASWSISWELVRFRLTSLLRFLTIK